MNWLLRFSLGLPARPADLAEIRRDVPELLHQNWKGADGREDWPRVLLPILLARPSGWVFDELRELAEDLRTWAKDAHRLEAPDRRTRVAVGPCEHPQCPRKHNRATDAVQAQAAARPEADEPGPEAPGILHLMVVGGGPGQKPLRGRFLDLVRRVHAGAGEAKKVFVTDPYLLTDASESSTPDGFSNFCEYLRAIRPASDAVLFIPPGPKRPSAKRAQWIESIAKNFSGLKVASFASKLSFHDRFYIVEHTSGQVRGVFGPSMNGLSDTDIALFGELEVPNALATLAAWFDLSTPSARARKPKKGRPRR